MVSQFSAAKTQHAQPQTEPNKTQFAALPLRAASDLRLTGLHFRVLMAIAYHDRFSRRRGTTGCWASHRKLCEEVGCDYTNLSKAIHDLIAWGYIESRPQQRDKRLRVYSVIHEDSWPVGQPSAEIVGANAKVVGAKLKIVGGAPFQATENKSRIGTKENLEKRTSNKRTSGRDSVKLHQLNVDGALALFERKIRQGKCSQEEFEAGIRLCAHIFETHDPEGNTFYRAARLLDEYREQS